MVCESTDHQLRVENFMEMAKQDVPGKPTMPDCDVRKLRALLILEEAIETVNALGFTAYMPNQSAIRIQDLFVVQNLAPDFEGVVDGCADLSVVTIGTLSAFGVKDGPVLLEVDKSNLTKFAPGFSIRGDGKLVKSPQYQPARYEVVSRFLAAQST